MFNKILITGGESMLGKHTRILLEREGCDYHWTSHANHDLLDLKMVRDAFNYCNPDLVINYAGFNGNIQFSQKYPADIFYQTSLMALNILTVCQEFKVKKVVNVLSSCALPPGPDQYGFPLEAKNLHNGPPHESIEAHGYAKRIWDIYARQLNKQYGLNSICVILNNCFGEFDNTDVDKTKAVMGIIKRVIDAKLSGAKSITCWGSGRPLREFIYAHDAAECVLQALEYYDNVNVPLNISTPYEVSIKELTELVCKLVEYDGEIIWDTSKSDGQLRKSLDTSNMKDYIDIEFTPFKDSLKNTIEWYINK